MRISYRLIALFVAACLWSTTSLAGPNANANENAQTNASENSKGDAAGSNAGGNSDDNNAGGNDKAKGRPGGKVAICHYDAEEDLFETIVVGERAGERHLAKHESDREITEEDQTDVEIEGDWHNPNSAKGACREACEAQSMVFTNVIDVSEDNVFSCQCSSCPVDDAEEA
ncbi:hypothetical protein HBA55_21040 [Pseudomaricurvus alkylphenolicus]|uniref:hypothetical protein n=1 Tax=Pseudomaricurvus alkylphenolicus TaxID=1306991 RepID=UPI0014223060|nr:hypothetical protein [Pseudomaricurvus alkylphenolicus]NIB42105.1 hypothetical protein [Pseudomaricurvus alkylphenolicus]